MIESIKEALENATPGPWFRDGEGVCDKNNDDIAIDVMFREDLHLIANTPTYIRYLLDELEKADKEIAKYHKLHDDGYNEMRIMNGELEKLKKPRPIDEWHEDYGDVLWWKFPIEEPPYCGTPLDTHWPEYHTHWTPIVDPTQIYEEASHE